MAKDMWGEPVGKHSFLPEARYEWILGAAFEDDGNMPFVMEWFTYPETSLRLAICDEVGPAVPSGETDRIDWLDVSPSLRVAALYDRDDRGRRVWETLRRVEREDG